MDHSRFTHPLTIEDHWYEIMGAKGLSGYHVDRGIELVTASYGDPSRHYHNLAHIEECLEVAESLIGYAEDYDSVRLALIGHDVIYDPFAEKGSSEFRSAQYMNNLLKDIWWHNDPVRVGSHFNYYKVFKLIWDTTWHEAKDHDEAIVFDADLARLACDWDAFVKNNNDIRAEYAEVPEEAFLAGRKAVFQSFLDMDNIFAVPVMKERFEPRARENLERGIEELCRP